MAYIVHAATDGASLQGELMLISNGVTRNDSYYTRRYWYVGLHCTSCDELST